MEANLVKCIFLSFGLDLAAGKVSWRCMCDKCKVWNTLSEMFRKIKPLHNHTLHSAEAAPKVTIFNLEGFCIKWRHIKRKRKSKTSI